MLKHYGRKLRICFCVCKTHHGPNTNHKAPTKIVKMTLLVKLFLYLGYSLFNLFFISHRFLSTVPYDEAEYPSTEVVTY